MASGPLILPRSGCRGATDFHQDQTRLSMCSCCRIHDTLPPSHMHYSTSFQLPACMHCTKNIVPARSPRSSLSSATFVPAQSSDVGAADLGSKLSVKICGSKVPVTSASLRMPRYRWSGTLEPRSVAPRRVISEPRVLALTPESKGEFTSIERIFLEKGLNCKKK
jgi:hypothetical protein